MSPRRSRLRLPPRTGLAVGLVLGMTIGVVLGRLVELRALGMVFGLLLGVVLGLRLDNDRAAEDHQQGDDGSIARALLWVLAGLVLLVLLSVATAPELLAAPGTISAVLLVVLAAGLPGAVVLLAVTGRRRRIDRRERGEGST